MLRCIVILAVVVVSAALFTAIAGQASDTCQRYTGGKCKPGQKTPARHQAGAVTHKATQAPPKGNHKGRDEYTPKQREKMMEMARRICRTKYGAPSRVYRIDYKRMEVWCEPPSF